MTTVSASSLELHTRSAIQKVSILSQTLIIGACCLVVYGLYELLFVPLGNARLIKYAFLIMVIGGGMYFVCKPLVDAKTGTELRDRLGFTAAFTGILGFFCVFPLLSAWWLL